MADLIAVLIMALAQLLGAGGDADALGARMSELITEARPVPLEEVMATAEGVDGAGIELLRLDFTDLLLDPLELDQTTINIHGISVARGRVSLTGITFSARISEDDLTQALRQNTRILTDARIALYEGRLELSGTYPVWGMRIPYRVAGTVVVENNSQLVFRVDQSGIGKVDSPPALNQLIEREINPVYDLARFAARSAEDIENAREQLDHEFELEIEELALKQGHIIVTGKA